jgi:PAP2 superfamily
MSRQAISPGLRLRRVAALAVPVLLLAAAPIPATAGGEEGDLPPAAVVVAWNHALVDVLSTANTAPPTAMRAGAIVATSVFDAVDGLTHRYAPYHLSAAAPRGASVRAAAAGAAHEALVALFPSQKASFDALLADTLPGPSRGSRDAAAIARGLAWGASVADAVIALRANDGFTATLPPYVVSPAIGRWQPTPPAFPSAPAFRQFATMTPWALTSPAQFLPAPPRDLASAAYARDFAEVESLGSLTSSTRSAFDSETALFWQSSTPVALWDPVADMLIVRNHLDLTDAARLLAQENMAMADAVIAVWNAKNYYDTWRPITAIQDAALDGNPLTDADPAWQPLIVTPTFQEYPAGHPGVSQAAAAVLADRFGDGTRYTLTSPAMPGVSRTLPSFSAGVAQVIDARVFGGIHFRFACDVAAAMGRQVATVVETTQMRRLG